MASPFRAFCALIVLLLSPAALAAESWQGRPVTAYIDAMADDGLAVIYSSGVLPDSLLIRDEPPVGDPVDALRAVLAPHGLALREGARGRLLVVRADCAPGALRIDVFDRLTLAPVAAATVTADGAGEARADAGGRALLRCLPLTELVVSVSADDYQTSSVPAQPAEGEAAVLRVGLTPAPEPLPEIIVSSSVYSLVYETTGSHRFLDRELTTRLPDVGDEALRAIDRLPGTANGGLSTRTHVRGGDDSEQLILLDGLRLYEPFHLKDFLTFSTIIDQRAIAGIDFYSAGYPARYGDRMSGVIDITPREAPTETVTELGLSLFNTSALSAGRFGNEGQGDWLVAARRGNLDLVARAVKPDYGTPLLEDLYAHVGRRFGEATYLSANSLFSFDKITLVDGDEVENARAKYTNIVFWLKAETDWTDALSSTTIASITDIANDRRGEIDNPGIVTGSVADARDFQVVGLKQNWLLRASDRWSFRAGFDLKRMQASYSYRSERSIEPPFDALLDNTPFRQLAVDASPDGNQYAVYGELRWRPMPRLVLDFGLRWDQQTYTTADDDSQVSPRFNALVRIGERTDFRFSAGRFYQAQEINELQFIDGVERFYPAARSTHYVAGLDHEFANGMAFELELYRKEYSRLYPRFENILDPLVLLPDLQVDRAGIEATSAIAQGAELMLSAEHDELGLQWWASYGWSETKDRRGGGYVPRSWDQTHAIKGGLSWDWREWNFSVAGTLHTGWPRTPVFVDAVPAGDGTSTFDLRLGERNTDRWSVFQSLDARASRRIPVSVGELDVFLEITNLYNRENPCCVEFERLVDEDGNDVLRVEQRHWLPLVPSIGVLWRF